MANVQKTYLGAVKATGSKIALNYQPGTIAYASLGYEDFDYIVDDNFAVTGMSVSRGSNTALGATEAIAVTLLAVNRAGVETAIAQAGFFHPTAAPAWPTYDLANPAVLSGSTPVVNPTGLGKTNETVFAGVATTVTDVGTPAAIPTISNFKQALKPDYIVAPNQGPTPENILRLRVSAFTSTEANDVLANVFVEVQLATVSTLAFGGNQYGEVDYSIG